MCPIVVISYPFPHTSVDFTNLPLWNATHSNSSAARISVTGESSGVGLLSGYLS